MGRQVNLVEQLQARLGDWWAPYHENVPKFFAADPGACMAGHRTCYVYLSHACLDTQLHPAYSAQFSHRNLSHAWVLHKQSQNDTPHKHNTLTYTQATVLGSRSLRCSCAE